MESLLSIFLKKLAIGLDIEGRVIHNMDYLLVQRKPLLSDEERVFELIIHRPCDQMVIHNRRLGHRQLFTLELMFAAFLDPE